jgi:uncharacterized membrane protein YphA (DoxX/SURF4 family)
MKSIGKFTIYFLRLSLAASFFSAVADRLGFWGPPGAPAVAWGNFANFKRYTANLNTWAPVALIPVLAWAATVLEIVFGLMLVAGFRVKEVALGSALLLLTFALSMTFSIGIKSPLNYSVFSASAAGFALFLLMQLNSGEANE